MTPRHRQLIAGDGSGDADARTGRNLWSWVLGYSLVILLTGCALGPDYKRPAITSPDSFRGVAPSLNTNSVANLAWWDIYKDPTLNQLIRIALENNFDIRIAATRIEQARQQAAQTRAEFYPQVGYQGAFGTGKNQMIGSSTPAGGKDVSTALLALNAMWEVDLWGRVRRLNEAARAQFLASEEARNGVTLSLVAAVAQSYFELLELDMELEIARRSTLSFGESYNLFNRRLEGGTVSKLDTSRAEAAMATAAASIPNIERQIVLKENELNLLLGHRPGPVLRLAKLLGQTMPPEVPAGLPCDLLKRRPDIRQNEQNLRAANARIGVAMTEFLPKIGLTALAGQLSPDLGHIAMDAGSAGTWSVAANATGPIFQGGKLVAQYREAKAAWDEARLTYEKTVLNALAEVANALIARQKLEGVRIQQVRAVRAYQESFSTSTKRYMAGKASYLDVLDSQQSLFPAENALAQTRLSQLLAVVQLYKALGGGWQHELDRRGPPASQETETKVKTTPVK
ncbi:MAG: efflux transporter outer membrane subunit [Verrucomicrobia bacterium]|nr:efflux transporter outer membrane subunit [Verrucomicrobiota bacterium]